MKYTPDIPQRETRYGYCKCGCGGKTSISKKYQTHGPKKGQPYDYIRGHSKKRPLAERLWRRVVIGTPDECWPWTGYKSHQGYGRIGGLGRDLQLCHRVAYELTYGPIPDNVAVLHHCDNPPCCNPAHLFLGDNQDNVDDKMEKGRFVPMKGETNGSSKFTKETIIEIRNLRAAGMTFAAISKICGVSKSHVKRIAKHQAWVHIP